MIPATLVRIDETYSTPPVITGLWTFPGPAAGADSTSLISIELPAHSPFLEPWNPKVAKRLKGKAYGIDLKIVSISCGSDKFHFSFLNKNDISLLDTVYEVGYWYDNVKAMSDIQEEPFVITNRDTVSTNKIYVYLDNKNGTIDMGTVSLELSYVVVQDRLTNEY